MFDRIAQKPKSAEDFVFFFQGQPILACKDDTVAAALLAAGHLHFRKTPISGHLRGPFCMMGACYDCLISVGGQTVQACMTFARPNLEIEMPPIDGQPRGAVDD